MGSEFSLFGRIALTPHSTYFGGIAEACGVPDYYTFFQYTAFFRTGVELSTLALAVAFYFTMKRRSREGSSRAASFMILPTYQGILVFSILLQVVHVVNISIRNIVLRYDTIPTNKQHVLNLTLVIRLVSSVMINWVSVFRSQKCDLEGAAHSTKHLKINQETKFHPLHYQDSPARLADVFAAAILF
jgi:hypothetical protein